jgi:hypothetical protein
MPRKFKRKRRRLPPRRPELSISQILAWADNWYSFGKSWPTVASGKIPGALCEKWYNVDHCLRVGLRGLPKGSSLARLLAEHRGVRNRKGLPPLRVKYILQWADAFNKRTGRWPNRDSRSVKEAPGETWNAVDSALKDGIRGLPGGSSLARLLAQERGVRNTSELPKLSIAQILRWADAHHCRTGQWPRYKSGAIAGTKGETWNAVDGALRGGSRGCPAGSSLARFLAEHRNVRNNKGRPPLRALQILGWADAYFRREGRWPKYTSGPIAEARFETWGAVDSALMAGIRGLPGGSSLAQLLAAHRGVRNKSRLPPLSEKQILCWADAYQRLHGKWPTGDSGPIDMAPGETWMAVQMALDKGRRGLRGGLSLIRFLAKHRGARNRKAAPPLSKPQIIAWAEAYKRRHGRWPTHTSGPVDGVPGETWAAVHGALVAGRRGLAGGSSISRLLKAKKSRRSRGC